MNGGVTHIDTQHSTFSFPPIPLKLHPPIQRKLNPFSFQQHLLQFMRIAGAAWRDLAACIDDAMPRHVASWRKIVQGVADLPCMSVESGQRRHLSVRRHAAARDAFHDRVDAAAGVGCLGWGGGARHGEILAPAVPSTTAMLNASGNPHFSQFSYSTCDSRLREWQGNQEGCGSEMR